MVVNRTNNMEKISYNAENGTAVVNNITFSAICMLGDNDEGAVFSAVNDDSIESGWKHYIIANYTREDALKWLNKAIDKNNTFSGMQKLGMFMTARELIIAGINHGSYAVD